MGSSKENCFDGTRASTALSMKYSAQESEFSGVKFQLKMPLIHEISNEYGDTDFIPF